MVDGDRGEQGERSIPGSYLLHFSFSPFSDIFKMSVIVIIYFDGFHLQQKS